MELLSGPTLGTLLRHVIELLDGAVDDAYTKAGLDYRPRYTPVVRALIDLRAASIRTVAQHAGLTHSAASQSVAQMMKSGLLRVKAGDDARERIVSLSPRAIRMIPSLQRLWATTNEAARELEAELPFPLTQLVQDAIDALQRRPFAERLQCAANAEHVEAVGKASV